MGYYFAAHFLRDEPDPSALQLLPESVGYRLFHSAIHEIWAIETFPIDRRPEYPFTRSPAQHGDSAAVEGLPRTWQSLSAALGTCKKLGLGSPVATWDLSRILKRSVLSVESDDDLSDQAYLCEQGSLWRLREYSSEHCLEVNLNGSEATVFVNEDEPAADDAELARERKRILKSLRAIEGVKVVFRDEFPEPYMHRIAHEELLLFAPTFKAPVGDGLFSDDPARDNYQLIAERFLPTPPPSPRRVVVPPAPFAHAIHLIGPNSGSEAVLPITGAARLIFDAETISANSDAIHIRILAGSLPTAAHAIQRAAKPVTHKDRGSESAQPAFNFTLNLDLGAIGDAKTLTYRIELVPGAWIAVRFEGILRQRAFDALENAYRKYRRQRR